MREASCWEPHIFGRKPLVDNGDEDRDEILIKAFQWGFKRLSRTQEEAQTPTNELLTGLLVGVFILC